MRIVDRSTFLTMPEGTLYSKFKPHIFGELCIKEGANKIDWWYQDINDAVEIPEGKDIFYVMDSALEEKTAVPMDFNCIQRDGLFDQEQLFAVWEKADVENLIKRLNEALLTGYKD